MSLSHSLFQLAEMNNITETNVQVQQQITFADTEMNVSAESASVDYRTITQNGMDISHFFERPINIQSYEWDDETSLFQTIWPWFDYFKNDSIRQKLRGYSRFTCEGLELDFRVNGSPFRYSSVLVSYRPLFCHVKRLKKVGELSTDYFNIPNAEFSGGHIYQDGTEDPGDQQTALANVAPSGNTLATYITRSQRQHVYLDVASSSGGKMILPFLYPKEALEIDFTETISAATLDDYMIYSYFMRSLRALGTIHMESLAPLRSLQAATTNGCSIQVYARPIGVKAWLASGNAGHSVQGLTSALSTIWTSIVSPKPLAAASQQVAMAPICDAEMPTIQDLARRKAIVALFDWSTTQKAPLGLIGMPIHPMQRVRSQHDNDVSINSRRYAMTPACFAAMNYRMWRGTARVTLKVVCSTFHRGRLRVTWDPQVVVYYSTTMQSETALKPADPHSQSYIWDIASASQVSFDIGFGSSVSKLTVPPLNLIGGATGNYTYVTDAGGYLPLTDFSTDNMRDYFNGILLVNIENNLQAPVTSTVTVVVEMSFPDLELYDAVSQTSNMDMLHSSSGAYGSNYTTDDFAEVILNDETYAVVPCASTRSHTRDEYIPQGVGTVPNMLDKDDKLDFVFQPTTIVPDFDNSTRENLKDLILRELTYDTHTFEVPLFQESGSRAVATAPKAVGSYYPPYVIKGMMPVVPGNFGTTSPCRNMVYDLNIDSGGNAGYSINFDGVNHIVVPNLARTHFAMLLKECYVGYRSTFKWRFTSIANNGVDIEYLAVERINASPNEAKSVTGRSGSYPVDRMNAPYAYYPNTMSDESFPKFASPTNVMIRPLQYNTGTTVVQDGTKYDYPAWYSYSGNTGAKFGTNTLMQLRKRMNSMIGSFYTGGVFCHGPVNSAEVQIPYFAKTRFLPSSCLAWAFSDSNQEHGTQLLITAVTKAACSYVTSVAHDNVSTTGDAWTTHIGVPKRATLNLVSSVSPGEDFSVSHFVNVPNIHLLTTTQILSSL